MSAKRRSACKPSFDRLEGRALLVTLTPPIIKTAYDANNYYYEFNGGNVTPNGSGVTIAIVVDGIDPNIVHDYEEFDAIYGQQPDFGFAQIAMPGAETASTSWDREISTDVEWAHSFAQKANIDLVESSDSFAGLMAAVNTARNLQAVSVVSMSWGAAEIPAYQSYSSIFTTPANHIPVTFVAASGDDGGYNNTPPTRSTIGVNFPASDPNVLAAGGTVLNTDSSGDYEGETAWSGSNGGYSTVFFEPSYQKGVGNTGHRMVPDVSMIASDVPVYCTAFGGLVYADGTSFAAPAWAGIIAISNQGRALRGLSTLDGATQTLPDLYALQAQADGYTTYFHDITTGSNGVYSAGKGYDLVTGLGSPVVDEIESGLSGVPIIRTEPSSSAQIQASPEGSPTDVAMAALPASGGPSNQTRTEMFATSALGGSPRVAGLDRARGGNPCEPPAPA